MSDKSNLSLSTVNGYSINASNEDKQDRNYVKRDAEDVWELITVNDVCKCQVCIIFWHQFQPLSHRRRFMYYNYIL